MPSLHCKKCLTGRSDDVLGEPCKTRGCDGTIEESPAFSTLVDDLPELMTCGRRFDMFGGLLPVHPDASQHQNEDHWQKFKSNGNRVCSYCGSLHPEDFFALLKASADAPEDAVYGSVPEIGPSDKGYKIYVSQPGVRNAHEGGIKFYTQHLYHLGDKLAVTEQQEEEYVRAVHNSAKRSEARFQALYGSNEGA
jgi:hypothetical protein